MRRRKNQAPARIPHPDPATELQLQRIIGCQRTIARYERLIIDYRNQMTSADAEQDSYGSRLRSSNQGSAAQQSFELGMSEQAKRIETAQAGIAEAEQAIEARHEQIAKLAMVMSATDLSYL